jgi:DNA-directed RNA polymerase, mitochondrial
MSQNFATLERQLLAEEMMLEAGAYRYQREFNKAKESDLISQSQAGSKILNRNVKAVENKIDEWKQEAALGKAGVCHKAFNVLKDIETPKLALIVSRSVINGILKECKKTALTRKLGQSVEDEMKFSAFKKQMPGYVTVTLREFARRNAAEHYQRNVLNHIMPEKDFHWQPMDNEAHITIGHVLLECFRLATGLIVEVENREGKRSITMIQPAEDLLSWIQDYNAHAEMLRPKLLPMLCTPKDWTSQYNGGYYHELLRRSLVKLRGRQYSIPHAGQMKEVYWSINALQKTAWQINTDVLEVMETMWKVGNTIALPNREDTPIPSCPLEVGQKSSDLNTTQRLTFEAWKKESREIRNKNAESRGKRIQLELTLNIAQRFENEDAIYFPYSLDWRGRIYAIPPLLNPQSADTAKALLRFAKGDAITDRQSANWLAIHGANLFGVDKVNYADRIKWVNNNEHALLAIAEDPYSNSMWAEADKPWQFLAWVIEWAKFLKQGFGFVSKLPIALDGTCNGLQHFSAMLRDEVCGQHVNLTDNPVPSDIYQKVCDVLKDTLKEKLAHAKGSRSTERRTLKAFHEWEGTNRKLTKRPVMILPYGGTQRACTEYVLEYLNEMKESPGFPFQDVMEAALLISPMVWASITAVVDKPIRIMAWLQEITRACNQKEEGVKWTTPIGFPITMRKLKLKSHRLSITLWNKRFRPALTEATSKLDTEQQLNGVAANFVHSMDACALMLYTNKAYESGITQFAMVHDSFGTTASRTQLASELLREAFVEMYQNNDVLEQFLISNEIPKLRKETTHLWGETEKPGNKLKTLYTTLRDIDETKPGKGCLVLQDVLQSQFFFA